MNREQLAHVLSPTALVHEVYIRLIDESRVDGADRARFLGIAGRAMRQILIEFARARRAQKRGKCLASVVTSQALS
jgi:ECF sigma factor